QRDRDETVQSTSMFRKMTLALLAGASCLAIHPAHANDAVYPAPQVLYANQPVQPAQAPAPMPVRTASADRGNMGGGFIQFLFGEGQGQGQAGAGPAPMYQQQPAYDGRRQMVMP